MIYSLLADLTLVAHLAFILFVVGGAAVAYRWRWAAIPHLMAAAWGAYIELSGRICPLTPLENRLRRLAGGEGYSESFIEHYLLPLIYPPGLTRRIQLALGAGVIVLNVAAYAWLLWRRRRSRGRDPAAPGGVQSPS